MPDQSLIPLKGWRAGHSAEGALHECTAVIPTFNRHPEVMRLLNAIHELPDQPGEVVIVDGHPSGDLGHGLSEWARDKRLKFDLVYAQSRPGLTIQRNAGIDVSSRQYLFFFDDDIVPEPGYFSSQEQIFRDDRQRKIGVVGACITNEMDCPIVRRWQLRLKLGLVPRDLAPMCYFRTCTSLPRGLMKLFRGTIPVDIVPGGASAWRRQVFEGMRFSEYFSGYSQGEDVESSLRAGRNWKLVCSGDARCQHLHAPGGRPLRFSRGRMDVVNRYFIWKRHTPDAEARYVALFWLDIVFQIVMEACWWIIRPWNLAPLQRALGLTAGALECLFSPPKYEEPPVRREFILPGVASPEPVRSQA